MTQPVSGTNQASEATPGLIWIGDHAVLDVAARAVTATNARRPDLWRGRQWRFDPDRRRDGLGRRWASPSAPNAFVVIRPGALLDASGASAVLDIPVFGPATEQHAAGGRQQWRDDRRQVEQRASISTGRCARRQGARMRPAARWRWRSKRPTIRSCATSGDVLRHREFIIADIQGDSAIADAASMAEAKAGLVTGTARVGADRIKAGGFGNLSLLV